MDNEIQVEKDNKRKESTNVYANRPFQAIIDGSMYSGYLLVSPPENVVVVKQNIFNGQYKCDMEKSGLQFFGKRIIERLGLLGHRPGSLITLVNKGTLGNDDEKTTEAVQFTKDREEANVDFYYGWNVVDPIKYMMQSNPEADLQGKVKAFVRGLIKKLTYDELEKVEVIDLQSSPALKNKMNELVSNLGIEVTSITFKTILPSKSTQEAYAEAKKIKIEAEAKVYEAEKRREVNKINAESNLETAKLHADAEAYRLRKLRESGLSSSELIDAMYSNSEGEKIILRGTDSSYANQGVTMGAVAGATFRSGLPIDGNSQSYVSNDEAIQDSCENENKQYRRKR